MKVEIRIEPDAEEKIVIIANRLTEEIEQLAARLGEAPPDKIAAYSERGVELVPVEQALRIYSENQQILIETLDGHRYALRGRLYEYESQLAARRFIRISNSEIVNGEMITGMDFSFSGTICLFLKGNVKTFVSRRYVSKIKKLFGV